jgi:hypothetical protein
MAQTPTSHRPLEPAAAGQELSAFLTPGGTLHLEWLTSDKAVPPSTALLQQEIHGHYNHDTLDFSRTSTGMSSRRELHGPARADSFAWLLFLGFSDRTVALSPSLTFWRTFGGLFAKKLRLTPELEDLRQRAVFAVSDDELEHLLEKAPAAAGMEYLSPDILHSFWKRLNQSFARAIQAYRGSVADFVTSLSADVHLVGRVFFHLVENKSDAGPFAFLATYASRLNREGKSKHLPLKYALQEFADNQKQLLDLLVTVYAAARQSALITELIETGELFHPLVWSTREAYTFLKEIPIYEDAGILCRIPNWWKSQANGPRLGVRIGEAAPPYVGMDAFLDFDFGLMLGDVEITVEEARRLIEEAEGMAFIKNKWVPVDPEKLKQALAAYEDARSLMKEGLTLREALQLQLNPGKLTGDDPALPEPSVSQGAWLQSVIGKLQHPDLLPAVEPDGSFHAVLREYQKKGLNWLCFLHSLQFGACLADDMGLGKTVQLLGFLNILRSDNIQHGNNRRQASLLIIPASLIGNWAAEIERFCPSLNYDIAHPTGFSPDEAAERQAEYMDGLDLVITTYAMVQRYSWLQTYTWRYVILDEAQAIKNPGARQTRAVKQLRANNRIILTGTPIENSLADLWSLFDFLNPGLLGNHKEFAGFSRRLKDHPEGYARLRKLIKPYVLRRMKTDKAIIDDLPDKVEMKDYALLTKRQLVLYRRLLDNLQESLHDSGGIQRKGLILGALMKSKQLCNHPDQYTGGSGFDEQESGKFQILRELCEIVYEKRERALVFTQFREMTEPLAAFLQTIFHRPGLVLHGGIPVAKRKGLVDEFQGEAYVPFMVLSLRAGGVGLNLTKANHVIHFDRWWNPAVENQATDRAFRIGQQKNVVVHKFITKGSIEEKIDRMLEDKQRLSEEIIAGTGEEWITELDNDAVMALFKLTF